MSYNYPVQQWTGAPVLGVPSQFSSSSLLQFKGARQQIVNVPAATGASVTPSSSFQIQIPQSNNAFIVPGSVYIRGKCTVTQTASDTVGLYCFGGQHLGGLAIATPGAILGTGGASSLWDRIVLTMPGGAQMQYQAAAHFRNAILPHVLSREFVENDLVTLESAGVPRLNPSTNGAATAREIYFSAPVDLPAFNAEQAFPLCILSGGLTLEFNTTSVAQAFYSLGATGSTALSNYALSELSLVYEAVMVPPEFKAALLDTIRERPFSMAVKDRLFLGQFQSQNSTRINMGVGLSSCRALVAAQQLNSRAVENPKTYPQNGLLSYAVYSNGIQITPPSQTDDSCTFAEMQRALQVLNDSNITSVIPRVAPSGVTSARNVYTGGQFAIGASMSVLEDGNFALTGTPVDQISLEITTGTPDAAKWGNVDAAAAATMYVWALHDTILSFGADGTVSVRK